MNFINFYAKFVQWNNLKALLDNAKSIGLIIVNRIAYLQHKTMGKTTKFFALDCISRSSTFGFPHQAEFVHFTNTLTNTKKLWLALKKSVRKRISRAYPLSPSLPLQEGTDEWRKTDCKQMLCEWFWNIKALFYEEKKSSEKKESRKLLKDKERLENMWFILILHY